MSAPGEVTARPVGLLEWKLLQYLARDASRHCLRVRDGVPVFWKGDGWCAGVAPAAVSLLARGWTLPADQFGNVWLNDAGLQAAEALPLPVWAPPKPPKLQARDVEVLAALSHARRQLEWASPLDCGGSDRSYHSASLTKLARHGYAECRRRSMIVTGSAVVREPSLFHRGKGSRHFRITDAGVSFLAASAKLRALGAAGEQQWAKLTPGELCGTCGHTLAEHAGSAADWSPCCGDKLGCTCGRFVPC